MIFRCRGVQYDVAARTLVMGIVNVTPDSFSDGGRYAAPEAAVARCRELIAQGADLLDLGGESTRPGSEPVSAEEQIRRLDPVLRALAGEPGAALSVDTRSAEVAEWALMLGAHVINDVSALADPRMAGVVAKAGAGLVLMHMHGQPRTMQDDPRYDDASREVVDYLRQRMHLARSAGVAEEAIVLDPGVGFGKTARHSFELLARVDELAALGRPVLVGASRKSFLGRAGGDLPVGERLEVSLAAASLAAFQGARIVRVHDVAASVRAIRVADAVRAARRG